MDASEKLQYQKLYELYEKLYNLILLENPKGWRTWIQDKELNALAEKKGTELLPLAQRIKIHEEAYVFLKKKYPDVNGKNGLMALFNEEDYY